MDDVTHELQDAAQELTPHWDVERAARLYAGTRQLGRRRTVQRTAGGALAAVAAGVALAVALGSNQGIDTGNGAQPVASGRAPVAAPTAEALNVHTVRLADGSRAELPGARSDLEVLENSEQRISLRLEAGRAHFDVVPNPSRSFTVEAAPYRVEVIGTVFDVERTAESVSVGVTRGKVRVYGPAGAEDLVAGQSRKFSRAAAAPVVKPEPALEEVAETGRPRSTKPRRTSSDTTWRSLSKSGQYDAAFESLRRGSVVDDEPEALMDAADAARLSGHPQNAVPYLTSVVERHGRSPVAPLAAFTLGRVYLDQLGQPDRAAASFERARKLSPSGSLAQDALAREVEALSKGGNAQKAYQRAQEYLQRYPNGQRLRAVLLYGGLE